MPWWRPDTSFPKVIQYLKEKKKREVQFSKSDLDEAIIMTMGVTNPATIANMGNLMIRLSFVKEAAPGIFEYINNGEARK